MIDFGGVWRRERDSNPRYGFPYSGFQDHPFQPLTHPSALYCQRVTPGTDMLKLFRELKGLYNAQLDTDERYKGRCTQLSFDPSTLARPDALHKWDR